MESLFRVPAAILVPKEIELSKWHVQGIVYRVGLTEGSGYILNDMAHVSPACAGI